MSLDNLGALIGSTLWGAGAPTFEWATPWAFVLLLPVFALVFRGWIVGTNRLAVPGIRKGQRGMTLRLLLGWVPSGLRIAGLTLLVVSFARPRLASHHEVQETEGLDIMLAIDTSLSMSNLDLSPRGGRVNRLEVAKAVVSEFVKSRPNDRIGLVIFGSEAFTFVPLTVDHRTLNDALLSVELGLGGTDGTSIGKAIAVSAKRLKDLKAESRVLVLLTDGQDIVNEPPPLEAASWAAAVNVRTYAIGVGAMNPLGDGVDTDTLKAVARKTNGRYFRATDANALQSIYDTIDELEPSTAEISVRVNYAELFRTPLALGAFFLMLQLLLSATWLRRGP